ncbi:pyridoxal 5'-phosphate synthase [Streptomyces sp. NBC_00083]|uniref:pyridoxine/pyridoxamine 5'-phosphate oxidase n=1 Tax=Streptomyces sp. NBC_00083 TaxID=2975647 RepID=UPI00224E843A|nr:pyridoxal 5'-phosphate synthase [Streptomyces sp. NBC_00083]MCX5381830.1 pyridoxal 5'-phosphate synthase [Streptomyces sp. NBC_00083]
MEFRQLLHTLRVWDTDLPHFDPADTPRTPLPLFQEWLTHAAQAGQVEPHTMALATVDPHGDPDIRTLTLHDADDDGWHFGSHSTSAKGQQLAAHPTAALSFYWPVVGRQVRVRGPVTQGSPAAAQADLHARSTGALAAALVGRMSEVLGSRSELEAASAAAWERAEADPALPVPTWTRYVLDPTEVEFFQGDARRRHVRLRYRREGAAWTRELLWP